MRKFDSTQPMVLSKPSSMDTSIRHPRGRALSAALTAMAAVRPPMVSAMGEPTRSGALSASPVTDIRPEAP